MPNEVVIIGLGKTGYSCVGYYASKNIQVSVVDHNPHPPLLEQLQEQYPFVRFYDFTQAKEILSNAKTLVISPGVSLDNLRSYLNISPNQECINDMELFCREAKAPIVAITGTNGKTTVATVMGEVLQQANKKVIVCGNIGVPVLDTLNLPVPDYYVIELSSFQLELVRSLRATAAVVLNISPDHMDRYNSYLDYITAKLRIYNNAQSLVINLDQDEISIPDTQSGVISFSMSDQLNATYSISSGDDDVVIKRGGKDLLSANSMPLVGHHHWQNALAVLSLTDALGLSPQFAIAVLQRFKGVAHRCQQVYCDHNIRWINDSKATNVGAMLASVATVHASLQGEIILIMGGVGKGADFSLFVKLTQYPIKTVILIGQDAMVLAESLPDAICIKHEKTMQDAVIFADSIALNEDAVILAPACASFDMFDNYQHRGQEFVRCIQELKGCKSEK